MNCMLHQERQAINTCEICNNGMCTECYEATEFYGRLCVQCALKKAREDKATTEQIMANTRDGMIGMAVIWLAGIITFIVGLALKEPSAIAIIIGLLICGLSTAINFLKKAAFSGLIVKILYFLVGLVAGLIANPVIIIKCAIYLKREKERMPLLDRAIEYWQYMFDQEQQKRTASSQE